MTPSPDAPAGGASLISAIENAPAGSIRGFSLSAGEALFREGDPAGSMYVLVSGQLEIGPEGGGAAPVLHRFPGSVVGELAFLTGNRRSATIIASTPAELCEITREALSAAVDSGAPWASLLLLETAQHLADWLLLVRSEVTECIKASSGRSGGAVAELENLRRSLVAAWQF